MAQEDNDNRKQRKKKERQRKQTIKRQLQTGALLERGIGSRFCSML